MKHLMIQNILPCIFFSLSKPTRVSKLGEFFIREVMPLLVMERTKQGDMNQVRHEQDTVSMKLSSRMVCIDDMHNCCKLL